MSATTGFATDSWRPNPSVTLKLGRLDHVLTEGRRKVLTLSYRATERTRDSMCSCGRLPRILKTTANAAVPGWWGRE